MNEINIDNFLFQLSNEDFNNEEFIENLIFFSNNETSFKRGLEVYEDTDNQLEVFEKLFIFLPITKKLIKRIIDTDFFDDSAIEILNRCENNYLNTYFDYIISYCGWLDKDGIDTSNIKKEIEKKERTLKTTMNSLKVLKKKEEQLTKGIEDRKIIMKKLNIEKRENIIREISKVEKYSQKIKELERKI